MVCGGFRHGITDAQITHMLIFSYAQLANHIKSIVQPLTHTNPNCTLCTSNDRDTWPHILSKCANQHNVKGLRIARHVKTIRMIVQTLQSNKFTRFYTLANVDTINNTPPLNTLQLVATMHMRHHKMSMPRKSKALTYYA